MNYNMSWPGGFKVLRHSGRARDCFLRGYSAGTGMGSSSCYLVGLLNALQIYKKKNISIRKLAELACDIEMKKLRKPIGKQDAYIASYGGILVMEIDRKGRVKTAPARVSMTTVRNLEYNSLYIIPGSNAIRKMSWWTSTRL